MKPLAISLIRKDGATWEKMGNDREPPLSGSSGLAVQAQIANLFTALLSGQVTEAPVPTDMPFPIAPPAGDRAARW